MGYHWGVLEKRECNRGVSLVSVGKQGVQSWGIIGECWKTGSAIAGYHWGVLEIRECSRGVCMGSVGYSGVQSWGINGEC